MDLSKRILLKSILKVIRITKEILVPISVKYLSEKLLHSIIHVFERKLTAT